MPSNGIAPNIVRDVLRRIRTAEDMIVVAHFPKVPASLSLKRESGPRFKDANELGDVRRWMNALCQ